MKTNTFYNQLKNLGITPQVAVDCGAAWGEWSSNFKSIFPETKVLGIDANDWCAGNIPGTDITEIQVLSDKDDSELTFYRKKENIEAGSFCTGDSIFKEISQHYQPHNTLECKFKTKTIFSLLQKHNIEKVDILKIDTQGSELLIMKGLGELLKQVQFIQLECSIIEFNVGGCTFAEIVEFLKDSFSLYDIINLVRSGQSTFDDTKIIKGGDFLFFVDVVFKNNNFKI